MKAPSSISPLTERTRVMTRRLFSLLLLSGLATQSMAGSQPAFDWTGLYAGANLGVLWGTSRVTANHPNFVSLQGAYAETLNTTNVDPGFQFGYLKMLDEHWVAGVEADFTYPATNTGSISKTACCTYDVFRVRNNLQGSGRVRLGYAIDRFFPYITSGVSWASQTFTYQNEAGNAYHLGTAQTGWVLGGGLEYGFLERLSGRIEYLFSDYGNSLNMAMPTISGVTVSGAQGNATVSGSELRAAINYRF